MMMIYMLKALMDRFQSNERHICKERDGKSMKDMLKIRNNILEIKKAFDGFMRRLDMTEKFLSLKTQQ
jgi:hypothetical protein